MIYLKIRWNQIRFAITQQLKITVHRVLSSDPDRQPAFAFRRQQDDAPKCEFTISAAFYLLSFFGQADIDN